MRKRRWNTIGLRGLMLLVLVIGLWLGWTVRKARQQREAVKAIQNFGGHVLYDWEFVNGPGVVPPGYSVWKPSWGKFIPGRKPKVPGWLRRAIGDEYFQDIAHVSLLVNIAEGTSTWPLANQTFADEAFRRLSTQFRVRTLQLGGEQISESNLAYVGRMSSLEELLISWGRVITDESFAHLAGLTNLRILYFSNSNLTDKGLKHLKGLHRLEILHIRGYVFSDEGLAQLRGLTHLKDLSLSYSYSLGSGAQKITDRGLDSLCDMKDLEFLDLSGWQVTEKGLDKLRGLKNLKVLFTGDKGISGHDLLSKEAKERLKAAMPNLKQVL